MKPPPPTPGIPPADLGAVDPTPQRKPPWLKVQIAGGGGLRAVRAGLSKRGLATVCDEARCPNRGECFGRGTATVMVLGSRCTRRCRFCSVDSSAPPGPPDPNEPAALVAGIAELGLRYAVLTMVTRDDLPDGGADHVARCVEALKASAPELGVELLGSDFGGQEHALRRVAGCGADVLAHNLEVVRRLTGPVRDPRSDYDRSLHVLRRLAALSPPGTPTKSSLLLGLGETEAEVTEALADLRAAGVDRLTLGQYLRPGPGQLPVEAYLPPSRFDAYATQARGMGFAAVFAGPLVRSSFLAEELGAAGAEPIGART